ncbi:MAG: glycoside hydrolase family 32 protein [Coriobacteriales bacterium]|nr:glycoside hydrolase family 32 protein [Coriobacteriales bacterium]
MSNPLAADLDTLRKIVEENANQGRFAQEFHLTPPVGWLNDPNGLAQLGDTFHAYFQYSPFNAEGGVKMWGHSTSKDLITWAYEGTALYPDQPFDVGGVYSGSALVEDGTMHVFYTGNVKREDEEGYDYVNSGREANTIHVTSRDGQHFSHKRLVLDNEDYPADDTNHVRDPKVWSSDGMYYMVQGARKKDDTGEVLVFESRDLERWHLVNRVTSDEPFGYMWECPDYFEVADDAYGKTAEVAKVLSVSPQGLRGGDWDRRNVYQSGYFVLVGDVLGECHLKPFALWDAGFDFYAPQTFMTVGGRRILIGWMGMPDEKTYSNLTVEDGWQHCFTIPREITARHGRILQNPVRELERYRKNGRFSDKALSATGTRCFDLEVVGIQSRDFHATIAHDLTLSWKDGRFSLHFADQSEKSVGAGRKERFEPLDDLRNVRVVGDVSSIEVFVNDGELTFSTRYYPEEYTVEVEASSAEIRLFDIAK